MPRPKHIIRPRKYTINIPEDVAVRLDLFLFSAATNKVPEGAYSRFFVERITEYLDKLSNKEGN